MPSSSLTLYRLEISNGNNILAYKDIYIKFSSVNMGPCGIVFKSKVYPNPVSDNLIIEIESYDRAGQSLRCDIRLHDSNGIMLRQSVNNNCKTEFNVSSLPKGFYYLHIYNADGGELLDTKQIVVKF